MPREGYRPRRKETKRRDVAAVAREIMRSIGRLRPRPSSWRRLVSAVSALALAAALSAVAVASDPAPTTGVIASRPAQEFVPGEVVVRFNRRPTRAELTDARGDVQAL